MLTGESHETKIETTHEPNVCNNNNEQYESAKNCFGVNSEEVSEKVGFSGYGST